MFIGLKNSISALVLIAFVFTLAGYSSSSGASTLVKWPKGPIRIAISSSVNAFGTGIKSGSDFSSALARSLQKWEDVADIEFEVIYSDATAISPPGPGGDGISLITIAGETENFLAFSKESSNASAVTRLFYDGRGNITEADIVLNPTQQFSGDQTPGTFDLETVLTHEIGHLLGLRHTNVPSSAMFDGVQRNNVLGTDPRPKEFSLDDISKVRALYGPNPLATRCCSSIAGKTIPISNVWLQEEDSGVLVQSVRSGKEGGFEFAGIDSGKYQILVQQISESGDLLPAVMFTSVIANKGENRTAGKIESKKPITFRIENIGLTAQVSNRAVQVAAGEVHRLTLIGAGLKQDGLSFGTTSSKINLVPLRLENRDYPGGIPALSFELLIDPSVKPGQYSIYVENKEGQRNYFLGGIWVTQT